MIPSVLAGYIIHNLESPEKRVLIEELSRSGWSMGMSVRGLS